jgi:hypothetical protein
MLPWIVWKLPLKFILAELYNLLSIFHLLNKIPVKPGFFSNYQIEK